MQSNKARFYLNAPYRNYVDVSDYDVLFGKVNLSRRSDKMPSRVIKRSPNDDPALVLELYTEGMMRIVVQGYEAVEIDIDEFAAERKALGENKLPLSIEGESAYLSYRLDFHSINGEVRDGQDIVLNVNFDFLYGIKQ